MPRFFVLTFFLLTTGIAAGSGFAGTDKERQTTTWVNEQGVEIRGNWTAGNVIEIRTIEDYYWHKDHFDPGAHYQVAPWLYDPFNLSRESGGDNSKD